MTAKDANATPAAAVRDTDASSAVADGGPQGPPAPQSLQADYVYALGRIEPRFPSLALEREFAQATGRGETAGLTDREALQSILSDPTNRYLVRQLCWVLTIEELETYILMPRDPADFDLLVQTVRPSPSGEDVDAVIGLLGPVAEQDVCNGMMVPIVAFDQIYSFDRDALVNEVPRPEGVAAKDEKRFRTSAREVLDRIIQLTDNAGATPEHRAVNYAALRYPAIYAMAADAFNRNLGLTAVEVRPSRLSGVRTVMDVIFTFTHRETDVSEMQFVRVDVTEEFPFLITKLSPYFIR